MNDDVRHEVLERAAGLCECGCGTEFEEEGSRRATIDHFWGRTRERESLESCWALTMKCHEDKTNGRPSSAWWLATFALHCLRHDFDEGLKRALTQLQFKTTKSSLGAQL